MAGVLETFLVQDVTSTPPDYAKLQPLGADAVVEFLIEGYGLRIEKGVPQTWVKGTGRMFRLADGSELWRNGFARTSSDSNLAPLNPAALADNPQPFREQMAAVLDGAAVALAQQLNPGGAPLSTGELQTPAAPVEQGVEKKKPPAAPPPDATAPTESPVDASGKKKAPRPTAPPPDATAPTEVPVDPKKH